MEYLLGPLALAAMLFAPFGLPLFAPSWRGLGLLTGVVAIPLAWWWVDVLGRPPPQGWYLPLEEGVLVLVSWGFAVGVATRSAQLIRGHQAALGAEATVIARIGALAALAPLALLFFLE